MRIAIVTPYTLLNLGLKHLLQKYFDTTPILYNEISEFFDNAPEQFDAYILFADTIILLASDGSHLPETSMTSLDIHESEESLLEKIQQFIEHLDKQSEILPHELSPRETEVLRLVAKGLMNKEIADRLNISINTVLSHRKNLTAKLGIKTVSGLSFYAMMNGYISDIDDK